MSVISGRAKKYDGTAIDYVSIFNWTNGQCIAQVVPDSTGAWEYEYFSNLNIGITYIADGCEPVTHGSYDFVPAVAGHKWWRVSNIVTRTKGTSTEAGHAAELRFNTESNTISNNPSKGFSAHSLGTPDGAYDAKAAFDGNPSTFTFNKPKSGDNGGGLATWWIGYEFDDAELVTSISVQMRQDMKATYGSEWQTADIDYSDDGVIWTKYGTIEPRIAQMDLSMITTAITPI